MKTLEECKKGTDFKHYVEHNPHTREMRQTGSSHLCVKGDKPGTAVIPVHNKELPTGTRKSVIRMLIAIGLGVLIISLLFG